MDERTLAPGVITTLVGCSAVKAPFKNMMFIFPFGPGTCYSSSLEASPLWISTNPFCCFSMAQLIPSRSAYNSEKNLANFLVPPFLRAFWTVLTSLSTSLGTPTQLVPCKKSSSLKMQLKRNNPAPVEIQASLGVLHGIGTRFLYSNLNLKVPPPNATFHPRNSQPYYTPEV